MSVQWVSLVVSLVAVFVLGVLFVRAVLLKELRELRSELKYEGGERRSVQTQHYELRAYFPYKGYFLQSPFRRSRGGGVRR